MIELRVSTNPGEQGLLRTVVSSFGYGDWSGPIYGDVPEGAYRMFWEVDEQIGGTFYVEIGQTIYGDLYFNGQRGNPPVYLTELPVGSVALDSTSDPIMTSFYSDDAPDSQVRMLNVSLLDCGPFDTTGLPEQIVIGTTGSENSTKYWIHTPAFNLLQNDLEQPLEDGGKYNVDITTEQDGSYERFDAWCSNVERSFLNEDTW